MLTIAIVPSIASEARVTLTHVAAIGVVAGGIFSAVDIVTFVYICDHVYTVGCNHLIALYLMCLQYVY